MRLLAVLLLSISASSAATCVQPMCVNRIDDDAQNPQVGTLRYAVQNAPTGGIITFDPALAGLTITLDTRPFTPLLQTLSPDPIKATGANEFVIGQGLTIRGPDAGPVTINGANTSRIFYISSGGSLVTITGVILRAGRSLGGIAGGGNAGMGGAIYLDSGTLNLTGVTLQDNSAVGGGTDAASAGGVPQGNAGFGMGGFNGPNVGGACQCYGASGGNGGFGGGGGAPGRGLLGPGAAGRGGFGGGDGSPYAGGGGAGLGGAIFAASGSLQLSNVTFRNNSAMGGQGGYPGKGKGAALFACSSTICGLNHDVTVVSSGLTFQGNVAPDAGSLPACLVRDDADVCGTVSTTPNSTPPPGQQITSTSSVSGDAAGSPHAFIFTFADSLGSMDIGIANILINSAIDGRQACYVAYDRASNTLLLVDDAGHSGGPFQSMPLGTNNGPSISNGQCLIAPGSFSLLAGNTLTLNLVITFSPAFSGNRIIYTAARDFLGGNNTGWVPVSVWQVR